MDIFSNAGGAGSFSFDDSSNPNSQPPTGRGRVRSNSFGLPERAGLIDLARTYLDAQARLWPTLVGTPAVPVAMPATLEPMADDFERRFRQQHAEVFRPDGMPPEWSGLGIAYLRFSDEGSNPRSLDQQLLNVLTRARHDGIFKIMLPMMSSFNEVFIDQLKSKVKRGMDDAFRRGDNIQPPGVGYRMVPVTSPDGSLVFTHKNTVEKRAEIDPEAAEWIRRGAEMIANEGKSPIDVARLFNEQKVGGKQTWSDNRVRKLYARERLVGREVFRTTKQVRDRRTGKVRYEKLPEAQWLTRESPYPKVLIRPICGGCNTPMILGRSSGKYQSFVCHNALHGMKGCKNRGYKTAGIIDEAVLRAVAAELFSERFVAVVTTDVNAILAAAAKRPVGSTKKLDQEIANRERQIARLTARLDKVSDAGGLDAIFDKVAEMEREMKAKRVELAEQQRLNRRPPVQRIKEKDVTAVLTQLRDLLQSDVGLAAPVLKG